MIVADVALATGRPLRAVAREPFAWTLYALLHVRRREADAARTRDAEGLRAAVRTNYAFAAPHQLKAELDAFARGAMPMPTPAAARAQGARILQQAIAAGFLPDPATTEAPDA